VCLLFIEATAAEAPGHYVWCKNPRALLGNATAHGHTSETCLRCLTQFAGIGAAERLATHKGICERAAGDAKRYTEVRLPKPEADGSAPTMRFTNFQRATRAPYVGYADFEAILVPLPAPEGAPRIPCA
jgi:hypothetical protein